MTMIGWAILPAEVGSLPAFLVLGCLAAMLVSVAKGGFGGSIGLLAGPIMIYACGGNARFALGLMLPLLIACDQVSLASWWRKWNLRSVLLLLPGAVVGIALGTAALWGFGQLDSGGQKQATNAWIQMGMGAIALGFVVLQAIRSLRTKPAAFRPVFWQGALIGTTAGFTSTLAHAAGPIVTMYMLPQRMPKGRYVATTVLYYWIGNLMKLPSYIALGLLGADSLRAAGVLAPAVVAGTLLGIFLHRRLGKRPFTGIVYVLLTLAGADLIRKAVTILWC